MIHSRSTAASLTWSVNDAEKLLQAKALLRWWTQLMDQKISNTNRQGIDMFLNETIGMLKALAVFDVVVLCRFQPVPYMSTVQSAMISAMISVNKDDPYTLVEVPLYLLT